MLKYILYKIIIIYNYNYKVINIYYIIYNNYNNNKWATLDLQYDLP